MKKINWNKQQENAITFENCNIIVSAGAGSGKTAVLTERITRLVESGESILNFAVCTFSRAAAEEMKERIRNALLERGLEKEADDAFLADINTMHALMSKVLESHFDALNLPPKFSILEKPDILMEQALNNTLNTLFEDSEFKSFAMLVSPKNDEALKELIKTVFNFCCNIPDYERFLEESLQKAKEEGVKPVEKEYCTLIKDKAKEFTNAYEMLLSKGYLEQKETDTLKNDLKILNLLLEGVEKNELPYLNGFETFPRKQPNKGEIYLIREPAKEFVKNAKEFKELLDNEEIARADAHNLEMLIKAVTTFDREFAKIKLDNGVLTFNDLERYAYKILQDDKIAEEYRNRYKYILVDEYQDTSRLQQAIIDRLRGDKNLFMVGDIKQSIYRFRHADPSLFYNTYNEYDTKGDNVRIDLSVNYRSKKNVLSFVNGVFSVLLNEGREYYPKEAFLKTEDKDDMHCVDIDVVAADKNETDDIEALQIVKRIEEMLTKKDGEADSKAYEPKDIAVLFKSVKQSDSTAAVVYRMLRDKGIAVQLSDTENNLFQETAVFLDFMSLIDNAENDIPLLSVMYSEIGRFSIDDIIEIRKNKKISFYKCVKSYKGDKSLEERINSFMQMLDELALQSRGLTVDELMAVALTKTGYLKILEKTKDSGAKAGQIYQIIDAAKSYEQMGYYGISGFVEYAESLKQLKSGIETEGFVQSGNAVSIMTMHKSKGLEFPVVIVGGLGKEIKGSANKIGGKQCEMHKDLGVGMAFFNGEKHCKVIPPKMKLIEMHNKKEDIEESMRLFYVAMTRAKERLFLVGCAKEKDLEMWKSKEEVVLEPKTWLDALYKGITETSEDCGDYTLNIQHSVDKKAIKAEFAPVEPEYNKKVTELLNEIRNTSVLQIPQKTAVTALTEKKKEFAPYSLSSVKAGKGGALAGTVTHALLSHLRYGEDFKSLLKRMEDGEYFTAEELLLIDENMVMGFMESELYKRMHKAKRIYREKPFMLEIDEKSEFADKPYMVQGIIDCAFEEEDGLVLVDYKTDNVLENAESILKERYSKQLKLYAYALEQLTGRPVKERIIMHLKTGKEIAV